MLNKKKLFPIVLLMTVGVLSARVVEKEATKAAAEQLSAVEKQGHTERDLFTKPFLDDLYSAEITGKFASSTDASSCAALLNKDAVSPFGNRVDQYFASKVKLDLVGNITYNEGAEIQIGIRAKSILGNARAYSTTKESIKLNEAVIGEHFHMLEPRVLFMREAWLNLELSKALGTTLSFNNFKIGIFPFEVGRGIALGENYAVSPASLGFYSDSSVDQYAPGALLNGTVFSKDLEYDIYMGLLNNNATNPKDTGAQLYDQLLLNGSYATTFARGFGRINYVFASRLKWTPINDKEAGDKVYLEPYIVYNSAPEQKVEFTGDSRSTLVTFGLAGEVTGLGYEFGFEGAFNRGHQDVYAWDRNYVTIATDSTTGAVKQVYTKIFDNAGLTTKTTYVGDTALYRPATGVSEAMNGLAIGATGKFNAADRFRDAHTNNYKGWMFVVDAATYLHKEDLKLAITGGITSGDVNANTSKTGAVRDYKGFVPLQELYFGKRVKSFFVMGPASSLARPHSLVNDSDFASPIEGFSNLRFFGTGLTYKPQEASHTYFINPNLFVFWQDSASLKFGSTTEYASNKLGVEFNVLSAVELIENVKLVASLAIFKPMQHYKDLKGTQLVTNRAELVKLTQAGIEENLPTLGDHVATCFSCGVECTF